MYMPVIGCLIKSGKKVKLLLKYLPIKCTVKNYTFIGSAGQEILDISTYSRENIFLNVKL